MLATDLDGTVVGDKESCEAFFRVWNGIPPQPAALSNRLDALCALAAVRRRVPAERMQARLQHWPPVRFGTLLAPALAEPLPLHSEPSTAIMHVLKPPGTHPTSPEEMARESWPGSKVQPWAVLRGLRCGVRNRRCA
eukprot:1341136-Rhodomonas_salina.1